MIRIRSLHRREAERGQSMVEFALIVSIFVLVLVGIFDVGRAVFAFNTLNNAAREGGRVAIVDQTFDHIRARAVKHAVSLGIDPTDVAVDFRSPDSPQTPNTCVREGGGTAVGHPEVIGCIAVVRVPYAFNAATPVIGQILGTLNLAGETRFRVEANCQEPSKASCPIGD
jgi:Flp pilus assembly protein TadG